MPLFQYVCWDTMVILALHCLVQLAQLTLIQQERFKLSISVHRVCLDIQHLVLQDNHGVQVPIRHL